jgi:hypothetical protein
MGKNTAGPLKVSAIGIPPRNLNLSYPPSSAQVCERGGFRRAKP